MGIEHVLTAPRSPWQIPYCERAIGTLRRECLDQVNVSAEDLKLGPLQDNRGPTETHALGAGSVAIDVIPEAECVDAHGTPFTTDQRGEPRPESGGTICDVGGFEVQP